MQISVWDLRAPTKRVAIVGQARKEQAGVGQVAERGMVFSLLLQSLYGSGSVLGDTIGGDHRSNSQDSGSLLSASVPRFFAGYEDGSLCFFDIRTFRYVLKHWKLISHHLRLYPPYNLVTL